MRDIHITFKDINYCI